MTIQRIAVILLSSLIGSKLTSKLRQNVFEINFIGVCISAIALIACVTVTTDLTVIFSCLVSLIVFGSGCCVSLYIFVRNEEKKLDELLARIKDDKRVYEEEMNAVV